MRLLVNPSTFGRQSIGLALWGCTNRPFYHIVVFPDRRLGRRTEKSIIEQIGSFDPLPNVRNEKLVALNLERINYWMARDAHVSLAVRELLGLAGFLPIHPKTYVRARHCREKEAENAAAAAAADAGGDEKALAASSSSSSA